VSSGTEPLETTAAAPVDEAVRRLALEHTHDLVTLVDPQGTIAWASPSWRRLGWRPAELPGTPILDLVHPEDAATASAGIAQVVAGQEVDAVVTRVRRADGGWAWIESTGLPVRDEDGGLRFLLGSSRDVSEREELRRRLRDLDAVYRFADAVADAGSLDAVLESAIDALLAATGAERASVLLAADDGVLRFRAWRGLSDAYRAATDGHSPWQQGELDPQPVLVADVAEAGFDAELERAVRAEGIAALAFVPLVHGERLVGKFMLYHDAPHEWDAAEVLLCRTVASHLASVTVRTQAQEALRESRALLESIFRAAPTGLALWDAELRFVRVNEAVARTIGVEPEQVLGRHVFDVFPGFEEQLAPAFGQVLATGEPVLNVAVEGETPARPGVVRQWLLSLAPVRDVAGALLGIGGAVVDVSAQRRAQAEAEAARSRLELLLGATERLTETLDFEETLRRVPELVVPRIAESCQVFLARDDGASLVRVAFAHAEPERAHALDRLDPVYDTRRDRRVPAVEVFRTGRPLHRPSLGRALLRSARPGEEEAVARLGTRSLIVLPLEAGGRRFGALSISSSEPGRHGEDDLELASELARRISLALDSVVLHRRAQESLAQLQAVLAQLPLGVVIADAASGRLVMANAEVERMWQREIVPGRLLSEYGSFERVREDGTRVSGSEWPLSRALREGAVVIGEREDFRRADGQERTMEINAAPVRDESGEIVAGVSIFSDVTDRRRAEERLRFLARASDLLSGSLDWERTLRAIAELAIPSFAGYLVVDLLGDDDELHCVAAAHADPKRSELVRRLRDEYPPVVPTHPVQVALRTGEPVLLEELQAEVDAMAHDQKHARAIRRIANTSGIVVPLVARGRTLGTISLGTIAPNPPFGEHDLEVAAELARRVSLALDNARLYGEAQERAQASEALAFVDDGVFLVDEAGVIRLWNPAAAASFRTSEADAVGHPVAELISDWPSLHARIPIASEPLGSGSRAQTLPVEVRGEERWLSISAVRFPGGTVYAFRDLTEERAVDQMKSDFVSTVSHELRTPLAAIYGAAVTLRREDLPLDEAQRGRLLEVIANEADRLARIVNDILWASRLESGRMSIAIERCDAGAIAQEAAEALRARLPDGLELEVAAPAGLPPVAADPDKLRQVLTNLLDNAAKYSPNGGRVELEAARTGGRIRFRVADEGLGIPPAEQDRIFEKFFRLDPNLARGVGGTGLGLYISRELVQRMDGRIWVASDGRSGSSFFVELPLA
jgi:PAS domain S-box-containing protein